MKMLLHKNLKEMVNDFLIEQGFEKTNKFSDEPANQFSFTGYTDRNFLIIRLNTENPTRTYAELMSTINISLYEHNEQQANSLKQLTKMHEQLLSEFNELHAVAHSKGSEIESLEALLHDTNQNLMEALKREQALNKKLHEIKSSLIQTAITRWPGKRGQSFADLTKVEFKKLKN